MNEQGMLKKCIYWFIPILVHALIVFVVQGIAQFIYQMIRPGDLTGIADYAVEVTIVASVISIFVLYRMYKKDQESLQKKEKKEYKVLDVILLGIGLCVFANLLIMLVNLTNMDGAFQQVSENVFATPILIQLLGPGIIIPISEEVLYRGLFYGRIRRSTTIWSAVMISSLFFGLGHGNAVQFIFATSIGIILSMFYEKYHDLVVPCIIHIAVNLTSLVFTWTHGFELLTSGVIPMIIGIIVAGAVFMFEFKRLMKRS